MITINLQWIAYILWAVASWKILLGFEALFQSIGMVGIGPSIGFGVFMYQCFYASIWGIVGWLVWRAFS